LNSCQEQAKRNQQSPVSLLRPSIFVPPTYATLKELQLHSWVTRLDVEFHFTQKKFLFFGPNTTSQSIARGINCGIAIKNKAQNSWWQPQAPGQNVLIHK
jgi:hypothetical protein